MENKSPLIQGLEDSENNELNDTKVQLSDIAHSALDSSSYDSETGKLTLNFKKDDGTVYSVDIDLAVMIDIDSAIMLKFFKCT